MDKRQVLANWIALRDSPIGQSYLERVNQWQLQVISNVIATPKGLFHIQLPRRLGKTRILQALAKHYEPIARVRVLCTGARSKANDFPTTSSFEHAEEILNRPVVVLVDEFEFINGAEELIRSLSDCENTLVIVTGGYEKPSPFAEIGTVEKFDLLKD